MTHPTRDDALRALETLSVIAHLNLHGDVEHSQNKCTETIRASIEGEPVKNVDAARQLLKNADNFTERENSSQYGKKTPEIYRAVNNSLPAIEGLDEAIYYAENEPTIDGNISLAFDWVDVLVTAARAYQQMNKDNNPAPLSTMGKPASLNQQAEPEGTPERGAFSGGGGGSGEVRERTCEKCGAYRIVQTGKDGNMSGKKCTCKAYR